MSDKPRCEKTTKWGPFQAMASGARIPRAEIRCTKDAEPKHEDHSARIADSTPEAIVYWKDAS